MKNIIYNKKTGLLFLLCMIFHVALTGQNVEEKSKIIKKYQTIDKPKVEIYNKYGLVHINSWDKDSVKVVIEMNISERNVKRLRKLKDDIDFDFFHTNNYIIIKTVFSGTTIFKDIGATLFNDGNVNSVEINYKVFLPKHAEIKIENKYGDIYCGTINGELSIDLSYGNLRGTRFKQSTNITLTMADADIDELTNGILSVNYSDVNIDNVGKLRMESKSSTINIEQAGELYINSRRDKYIISSVQKIDAIGSFSDFKIYKLGKLCYGNMKYGDFQIKSINSGFKLINMKTKYTDVRLALYDQQLSYYLEIIHTGTDFTFPVQFKKKLNEKLLDSKDFKYKTYGTIGKKNASKVMLITESGELMISH